MVWLAVGTLVCLKYSVEPGGIRFGLQDLRLSDTTDALILIALAAASFRFLESARFLDTFYPDALRGKKPNSNFKFEFPSLFGGRWWMIPVAVILAVVLLGFFPFGGRPMGQIGIRPIAERLIFLTLVLFFAWYVCRAVIGTIVRWRMKPHQADVHCRSLIASEFWKETYDIENRRAKKRAKRD